MSLLKEGDGGRGQGAVLGHLCLLLIKPIIIIRLCLSTAIISPSRLSNLSTRQNLAQSFIWLSQRILKTLKHSDIVPTFYILSGHHQWFHMQSISRQSDQLSPQNQRRADAMEQGRLLRREWHTSKCNHFYFCSPHMSEGAMTWGEGRWCCGIAGFVPTKVTSR